MAKDSSNSKAVKSTGLGMEIVVRYETYFNQTSVWYDLVDVQPCDNGPPDPPKIRAICPIRRKSIPVPFPQGG